jgi:hypothetical protein
VYAFTYSVPGGRTQRAFRLSGATETTRDGSPADSLLSIVDVLDARMAELGVSWDDATAVSVYGARAAAVEPRVVARLGAAGLHGVTWFPSVPPIQGFDFEIDARGVCTELTL